MGDFNTVFRSLRQTHGYTQKEIADKLGISKSAVSMYENGSREPDLDMLKKIADIFEVGLDCLSGRNTSQKEIKNSSPYENMETLIARNGNKLSTDEKMKLIRMLSDFS